MKIISKIYRLLFPKGQFALMRDKIKAYRERGATIGENVRLWGNIDAVNPHLVTIGDCVCLAERSYIITHCPVNPGAVVIGDNVWIGYASIILPNVTIGECSLIGAGSVVTRDIPSYSVVAGNPAEIIGTRHYPELWTTVDLIKKDLPVGKVERDD